MGHRLKHFWHHLKEELSEEIWNTLVNINSIFCAIAIVYLIYAAGASVYFWTLRPIEFGVIIVFILLCTEVVLAAIEEGA